MENFRTPNFALVADILFWLVQRYDPNANIPDGIDTESQRVHFLQTVAQVVASKARILLKTKNLYAADGRAVKELLKLARVLDQSVKTCQKAISKGDEEAAEGAEGFTFSIRQAEVAALRATATEITERGAKVHDLLKKEGSLREERTIALRFLETVSSSLESRAEHQYLERSIRNAISTSKVSQRMPPCFLLVHIFINPLAFP